MQRTRSMEIRMLRHQMHESPPPPPFGATVREWFAGLALMNPALMSDVPAALRAQEAVRLADELVKALATPRVPTLESMAAPTSKEMEEWDQKIIADKRKKEGVERETCLDLPRSANLNRKPTLIFDCLKPPSIAPETAVVPVPVVNTRYMVTGGDIVQESLPTRPLKLGK